MATLLAFFFLVVLLPLLSSHVSGTVGFLERRFIGVAACL